MCKYPDSVEILKKPDSIYHTNAPVHFKGGFMHFVKGLEMLFFKLRRRRVDFSRFLAH